MLSMIKKMLYRLTELVETIVSVLMILVIAFMLLHLFHEVFVQIEVPTDRLMMERFLTEVLGLVVALEFVKMLIKHSPSTIAEVLLFTIAKIMITKNRTSLELLFGALAVAALFATRKYLFGSFDETERITYRGSLMVRQVNWFNKVQLPFEGNQTLAQLIEESLKDSEQTIATGAVYYYGNVALRIAKMSDGKITRVEFIQSGKHL